VPGVYAVGDVAGPPYFMAVARKRGMIAAKNIMGEKAEWDDSLPLPDHIYLPPLEATMVGLTEKEAREKYGDALLIQVPWGPMPKDPEPMTFNTIDSYLKTAPRMTAKVLMGVASETSSAVLFMLRIARRASKYNSGSLMSLPMTPGPY
jgi:pyruvate/2-oxoglutarate dehydrogenase complex dihydrolipoamide dehydrogenase (E3) component